MSKQELIEKLRVISNKLDCLFDMLGELGISDIIWNSHNEELEGQLTLCKVVNGTWTKVDSNSIFLSDEERKLVKEYEDLGKEYDDIHNFLLNLKLETIN